MPGLINERQYEIQKAEICEKYAFAADAFDTIEWSLLRSKFDDLPLVVEDRGRKFRYAASEADVAIAPQIMVVITEEYNGGENKIVLLGARVIGEPVTNEARSL